MGRKRTVMSQRARRSLRALVLIACLFSSLPRGVQGQPLSPETRLKATYLRRMLSFVQWPDTAIPEKGGAFQFCIAGDYMLGFALAQELRSVTIGDRRVDVRWTHKEQDLRGCQALFISSLEKTRVAKVLESVRGANVLTFGETDGFVEAGGVVQLSYENNAVRFQINLTAARAAELKIDARLLALAKRVVTGNEMPGG